MSNKSQNENVLPLDGIAEYYSDVFNQNECQFYLDELVNNILWKHDELLMFGKQITTKRKVAWYGDKPFLYKYSNNTKKALNWGSGDIPS